MSSDQQSHHAVRINHEGSVCIRNCSVEYLAFANVDGYCLKPLEGHDDDELLPC